MRPNPIFLFHNAGRFISRGHGRHPSRTITSHELIYVLSGTLDMFEENREFHLTKGDRLLLFPGRRHGGLAAYPPDLSFFWVHFSPEDREGRERLLRCPQSAPVRDADAFVTCCNLLLQEQKAEENAESCNYLVSLLVDKAEKSSGCALPLHGTRRLIEETDRFILLHFDEELSTSFIAGKLQCHPDYLGRIYAAARNCTIGEAIRKKRIAHACRLLETSMMSIKQIAYESGFNDPSHFRRQFFQECAVTPRQYRKLHTGGHINTE